MPFCGPDKIYFSSSQQLPWASGAEKDWSKRGGFSWTLSRSQIMRKSGTYVPGRSTGFCQSAIWQCFRSYLSRNECWQLHVARSNLLHAVSLQGPVNLAFLLEFSQLSNDSWMRVNRLVFLFLYSCKNEWNFSCSRKKGQWAPYTAYGLLANQAHLPQQWNDGRRSLKGPWLPGDSAKGSFWHSWTLSENKGNLA